MKTRLEDMRWPEVEEVLKEPNVLILPIGCTEQHGRHLPLSVDSRCTTHLAELAARKVTDEHNLRVLVAPTIPYGDISAFRKFPGTVGISVDTASMVYEEIVRDFISHGFQNILLFNGHYGNVIPISVALRRLGIDFPNKGLYAIGWFSLGTDVIGKIKKSKVMGGHAGEIETAVTLAIQPENVQLDKAVQELQDIPLSQKWWPSKKPGPRRLIHLPRGFPKMGKNAGVMGDATVATKEFGEKVIEAVVDDLTELLLEIVSVEDRVKGY